MWIVICVYSLTLPKASIECPSMRYGMPRSPTMIPLWRSVRETANSEYTLFPFPISNGQCSTRVGRKVRMGVFDNNSQNVFSNKVALIIHYYYYWNLQMFQNINKLMILWLQVCVLLRVSSKDWNCTMTYIICLHNFSCDLDYIIL